ncbi:MAG TPA: hypothetical protein VMU09_12825, partial [Acidimicrobiales bacterium]|nr:hypothetical protein [Acidimicrobiales bacterium]
AEPEAEAATEAGTEVGTEAEAEDLALAAAADVLVAPDAGDAGEAHAPGEPVAAAGGPEPEEQDEEARRQAVEDLFARLRANAPEDLEPPSADAPAAPAAADTGAAEPTAAPSVAAVAEVPVDTAPAKAPKEPKERAPRERAAKRAPAKAAAAAGKPAAEPAAASSAQPVAVSEPAAAGAPAADGADEGDGVAIDPDLARRDEVLTPVVTAMARRLKRALQDDQNDILDRLRASGRWGPEVLPSVEDHLARYSAAAADQLAQASGLGASFAGGGVGAAPDVSVLSNELALSIVVPLRRRLDGEDAPADSGDDALADRVGAAFREWKGARIERLAGDEAVAAFGAATLAAAAAGSSWRWVVDDGGDECPDCDDNALAGPTPPGEEYPTGHVHPPAHAGCRCLIAPVTT